MCATYELRAWGETASSDSLSCPSASKRPMPGTLDALMAGGWAWLPLARGTDKCPRRQVAMRSCPKPSCEGGMMAHVPESLVAGPSCDATLLIPSCLGPVCRSACDIKRKPTHVLDGTTSTAQADTAQHEKKVIIMDMMKPARVWTRHGAVRELSGVWSLESGPGMRRQRVHSCESLSSYAALTSASQAHILATRAETDIYKTLSLSSLPPGP